MNQKPPAIFIELTITQSEFTNVPAPRKGVIDVSLIASLESLGDKAQPGADAQSRFIRPLIRRSRTKRVSMWFGATSRSWLKNRTSRLLPSSPNTPKCFDRTESVFRVWKEVIRNRLWWVPPQRRESYGGEPPAYR